MKLLMDSELSDKERAAVQLRVEEQSIAQATMDAIRRRKGIPLPFSFHRIIQ